MSEIALKFLFANLAAACAVLAVFVLRKPARAMFGAPIAYALWLLVPLAALASMLPPRVIEIIQPVAAPESQFAPAPAVAETPLDLVASPPPAPTIKATAPSQPLDLWALGLSAWLAGAIAMLLWQLRNQSRFMADARAGFAGPAVAGFLRPRIVTPTDFAERFDTSERNVILAHEQIHIARNDARINALVAFIQCLCWFNPLIHLAAHVMRIDQELACDAAVARRHPKAKAVYASALLKAQLAARPLPLGCYWPARSQHPLTERIEMLKRPSPNLRRRIAGAGVLACLAITASVSAWAMLPPQTRIVETPKNQPAPSPAPKDFSALPGFDDGDRVDVTGTIARIGPKSDFTLQATSIRRNGGPAEPDNRLWRINMDALWAGVDRIQAGVDAGNVPEDSSMEVGPLITVSAYRATDKSCQPACMAQAYVITRSRSAASQAAAPDSKPAPQPAPQTPSPTKASAIDQGDLAYVRGHIEKIEFGPTTYVAYVRAENMGADPYVRAQINTDLWALSPTNYFGDPDNRAEIAKNFQGKRVDVYGQRPKNDGCAPTCSLRTIEMFFQPSANRYAAGFAGLPGRTVLDSLADTAAPITLTGKVMRFDTAEESATPHGVLWVEAQDVTPASTQGAKPGTVWRVVGFPGSTIQSRFWQGAQVTINGVNVRDKACQPDCLMIGKQIY